MMSLLSFRSTLARSYTKTIVAHDFSRLHVPFRDLSFEAAGIRPSVATSLRSAFPNIEEPTAMQRALIRAISENRNVLLQDDTGTGKSFAAMLALLNKVGARKTSAVADGTLKALLLVPHRDLAYQYLYWMHYMTLREGDVPCSLAEYAQVLLRHVNKTTLQGLPARMQEAVRSGSSDQDLLMQKPPQILIATPNAAWELMEHHPEAVWLATRSTVVVDEVDALVRVSRQDGRRASRRKVDKHVPDLVRILDRLYPASGERSRSVGDGAVERTSPQLIMISATLRHKLQGALFDKFRWMERREVLKLIRTRSSAVPSHRLGRSAVHHVLVVSKTGEIRNMEGARPMEPDVREDACQSEESAGVDEEGILCDEVDDTELVDEADKELIDAPLGMDTAMLEAVAAVVALDVPRAGLLVLPATGAVRKVVFELRQLGVNAHPLNLAKKAEVASEENPVLIVATLATIRGIDLPGLTHVILIGVPEGRSGDGYMHVAGRVGRFGGRGRVVTVVEERSARRMGVVLSRLGIRVDRLAHFG